MTAHANPTTKATDGSSFLPYEDDLTLPSDAGDHVNTSDVTLEWIKEQLEDPSVRVLDAEGDRDFPIYNDDSYVQFLKDRDFKFDTNYEARIEFYAIEKPARLLFRKEGVGLGRCLRMTQALQIPSGFAMAFYDTWLALVTAKAVCKVVEWKTNSYHHRLESQFAQKVITVLWKNYVSIKEALDSKIKAKFIHDAEELNEDYEAAMQAAKRARTSREDFSPLDF